MARKRKWGNTNSARARIKRWAKANSLPPTDQWQGVHIESGDNADEYKVRIVLWYAGNEKADGSPPDDIEVTLDRDEFQLTEFFYARGKAWRQSERGADIEGFSDDFDYMLEIDIDS